MGDNVALGHEKRLFSAECQREGSLLYVSYEVSMIYKILIYLHFRDL